MFGGEAVEQGGEVERDLSAVGGEVQAVFFDLAGVVATACGVEEFFGDGRKGELQVLNGVHGVSVSGVIGHGGRGRRAGRSRR